MKLFVAAKSFIVHEGKVLVIRESEVYKDGTHIKDKKFGIPGGRIETGEGIIEGLKREAREEVGLDVTPVRPLEVHDWRPTIQGEKAQIIGIFFLCETQSVDVTLGSDHVEYKWIDPAAYASESILEDEHAVFQAYLKSK